MLVDSSGSRNPPESPIATQFFSHERSRRPAVKRSNRGSVVVGASSPASSSAAARSSSICALEKTCPLPTRCCSGIRHRQPAAAAVARVREAGLTLTLWHEERESELQALVALGPDAICTDEPALLRRIVDRFGRATGEEAPGAQGSSTARPGRVSQETS